MSGLYPKVVIDPTALTAKEIFAVLAAELGLEPADRPDAERENSDIA